MAHWSLEVYRMAAYVSLPIFCFYLFNKPEYFSEFLIRNKHFYFPKDDPHSLSLLEEFKKAKEKENEEKLVAEIERFKSKNK